MRESVLKRVKELIKVGKALSPAKNTIEWNAEFHKWELSCVNFLEKTFGDKSYHNEQFKKYLTFGNMNAWVKYGNACLESAKEEIEKGFLYKIEQLISFDFFDSILEYAEDLLSKEHKDPAAVLGRVVIENTLKQIAKRENIQLPTKVKLHTVNDLLWKRGIYTKVTWRLLQGYIALGNYAAHGDFNEYNKQQVEEMLQWIRKNLTQL